MAWRYFSFHYYSDPLINSAVLIEEIFRETNDKFEKLQNFLREEVTTESNDEWSGIRRCIYPSFKEATDEYYAEMLVTTALEEIGSWNDGQQISVLPTMERITARAVGRFCFGDDYAKIVPLVGKLLDALLPIVSSPFRFPTWLPIGRHIKERWCEWQLMRQVEDALTAISTGKMSGTTFTTSLLKLRDDKMLSPDSAKKALVSVMLAAHGVPAAALSWIWFVLLARPQCYEKVISEVDQIIGNDSPSLRHVSMLQYTRAVVNETLRLYPPTWLLARKVKKECLLGGYKLRPRQVVLFSAYVMGRDQRYYNQPQAFIPERWYDDDWVRSLERGAYFPFGSGPRFCLGRDFALSELVLLTAVITQHVRFSKPKTEVDVSIDCRRSLIPSGFEVIADRRFLST